jgi:mevalonate kinase
VTGRARGKVILLGEHAVVYGVPALAVGIERGVWAEATLLPDGSTSRLRIEAAGKPAGRADGVEASSGASETASDAEGDLARAFREVLRASGADRPFSVVATTELPPGAGLGCSAALGVAIGRALGEAMGREATLDESIERATAWERVFHGNPSGVDAAVAAQGGCVRFVRGQAPEAVRLRGPLELAIGHTGVSSSTKEMVEAVARLRDRRPDVFQKSLDGIRSLVENARLALQADDLSGLGKLMDLNQMLLSGMFLSTCEIESLCASAREHGALGAKLTGAGGGGCVVALCDGTAERVVSAWKEAGFEAFVAVVNPPNGGLP